MQKIEYSLGDKRLIKLQAWKLRDSAYVVQMFVGQVEVRRWVLTTQVAAKEKLASVYSVLAANHRETIH